MSRPILLDKIEWTAQKRASLQVSGDQTARVTPVPIPNTEVKPRRADDTARATVWERRSSPGLNHKGRLERSMRPFVFGDESSPLNASCKQPRLGITSALRTL